MKTIAVILMALLGAMPFVSKSVNNVNFSVEVKVEKSFSAKDLNVIVSKGEIKEGNTILLQKHDDYLRAMKDRQVIISQTTNKAEIIAFFGNERITIEDAMALINNKNDFEEENLEQGQAPQEENLYYTIEILTNDKQTLQDYIKACPNLEKYIMQKDENLFVVGHFLTYNGVLSAQENFSAAGLYNTAVVAYEGDRQVPLYELAKPDKKYMKNTYVFFYE